MADRYSERHQSDNEAYDFAHPPVPACCPTCLRDNRPEVVTEDHNPALLAALRDVILASTDLRAEESVPKAMWAALRRASDVIEDVSPSPF